MLVSSSGISFFVVLILINIEPPDYFGHEIIGVWQLEVNISYTYTFYSDGRGTRAFGGHEREIVWRIHGEGHVSIDLRYGVGPSRNYNYFIAGNHLVFKARGLFRDGIMTFVRIE